VSHGDRTEYGYAFESRNLPFITTATQCKYNFPLKFTNYAFTGMNNRRETSARWAHTNQGPAGGHAYAQRLGWHQQQREGAPTSSDNGISTRSCHISHIRMTSVRKHRARTNAGKPQHPETNANGCEQRRMQACGIECGWASADGWDPARMGRPAHTGPHESGLKRANNSRCGTGCVGKHNEHEDDRQGQWRQAVETTD